MIDYIDENDRITRESYDRITALRHAKIKPNYYEKEFGIFQKLLPAGKILDVGCGNGRDAHYFVDNGYDYTGVDYSTGAVNVAQNTNPRAHFQTGNLYHLDFSDETFEGFWSAAVYLHVPKSKMFEALKETKRVTKKNGVGFITVKEGDGEELLQGSEKADHRFFVYFTDEEFRSYLKKAGLEIVEAFVREHAGVMKPDSTRWLTYFVRKT